MYNVIHVSSHWSQEAMFADLCGSRYQSYYTLVNIIEMRFCQHQQFLLCTGSDHLLNTLVQSYSSSNRNAKHIIDDAPFAFFQSCIFRKHFKKTNHAAPT